jgi:hypothetical protein
MAQIRARDGEVAALPDDRAVRLELPTSSAGAEMAAQSRKLGDYHIATDNVVGLGAGSPTKAGRGARPTSTARP